MLRRLHLNREEKNLASYISSLEAENDPTNDYAVSVNVEVKFSRSKASDALTVQLTNDPTALKLHMTEEQIKDRYPLNYASLTDECRRRYRDFLINKKYHGIRKPLKQDRKYCLVKRLDPDNPKSPKQEWYSYAIFSELDKHYTRTI